MIASSEILQLNDKRIYEPISMARVKSLFITPAWFSAAAIDSSVFDSKNVFELSNIFDIQNITDQNSLIKLPNGEQFSVDVTRQTYTLKCHLDNSSYELIKLFKYKDFRVFAWDKNNQMFGLLATTYKGVKFKIVRVDRNELTNGTEPQFVEIDFQLLERFNYKTAIKGITTTILSFIELQKIFLLTEDNRFLLTENNKKIILE